MKMNIIKIALPVLFSCGMFTVNAQIFVNQAGYLTNEVKYVYQSSLSDSFFVHEKQTGSILFKDKTILWQTNDPATNLNIYRGDFSSFTDSGTYFITDKLGNKSFTFSIVLLLLNFCNLFV